MILVRALLHGETPSMSGRYYPVPQARMSPLPAEAGAIPLWIGSWGSTAGLRRVARFADGWLASAYNTSPAEFAVAMDVLSRELRAGGREAVSFPHALVTMWTRCAGGSASGRESVPEPVSAIVRIPTACRRRHRHGSRPAASRSWRWSRASGKSHAAARPRSGASAPSCGSP